MARTILPVLLCILFAACSAGAGTPGIRDTTLPGSGSNAEPEKGSLHAAEPQFKKAVDMNVKIAVIGKVPASTETGQQIYYRIFIDQTDAGRTTIAGSEEEKVFESKVIPGIHTIHVEKYILDEHKGRYVKVKNIDQPKPDAFDFTVEQDRIVILHLKDNGSDEQAEFTADYERESIF